MFGAVSVSMQAFAVFKYFHDFFYYMGIFVPTLLFHEKNSSNCTLKSGTSQILICMFAFDMLPPEKGHCPMLGDPIRESLTVQYCGVLISYAFVVLIQRSN